MASPLVGSAARTGFAAAGGVIAGPLGAIAGSLIGGALFGSGGGPDVEGPRLDDLDVASSAYGRALPRGYGLAKVAGTIIWATEIEEDKDVDKVGGGLFGGGQKVTTYKYFANLAVAFGEGPAKGITRLWAGDKLLWDKGEDPDALAGGLPVGASVKHLLALRSMRVRVYLGDEAQEPDPFIASKVKDETGEANATPAHRGLVYVVLEHLPLEDFGNRIPPITAEVNWLGQDEQPVRELEVLSGSSIDSNDTIAPDWNRWRAYFRNGDAGISRVRLDSMVEELSGADVLTSHGDAVTPYAVTRSGIVLASGGSSNSNPIVILDPDTLHVIHQFGFRSNSLSNNFTNFQWTKHLAPFGVTGTQGTRELVGHVGILGGMGLLEVVDGGPAGLSLEPLWFAKTGMPAGGDAAHVIGGNERHGSSDVWWISEGDSSGIGLLRLRVNAVASRDILGGTDETIGVFRDDLLIDLAEIDPAATTVTPDNVVYVPELRAVAILAATDTGSFWVLVDGEGGAVRSIAIPTNISAGASGFFHLSRVLGTEVVFGRGGRVVGVDLATGRITLDQSGWDATTTLGLTIYDGASDTVLNGGSGKRLHRLFLRRSSSSVELGTVVTDLCTASGLGLSELDTTELTDQVRGFVLAKQTSYRKALELLAATYLFDVVESDFRLAFKKRGRPVTRVIHEDDLVPVGDDGERWVKERAQDVELPLRFSVVYRDVERDSDRGVQSVQRVSNPDATMRSKNETSLELPLTLAPAVAKGVAQSLMFSAWIERVRQQTAMLWSHVDLDPADVIQLQRKSGELQTLRVERLEIGANLEVRLETVVEEASSYTHAALADGGRQYRRFELPGSAESRLAIMDMPLVRDEDDIGRAAIQLSWSAGADGVGRWPGGTLYYAADGFAFVSVDEQLAGMDWGVLLAPVGDVELPFQTDDVNTVEVFMREGTLASVTELEMLQGQNLAALIKTSGEVELVNFRDAIPDPDVPGRYTLSRLLRGRRGTEPFTGAHVAGASSSSRSTRRRSTARACRSPSSARPGSGSSSAAAPPRPRSGPSPTPSRRATSSRMRRRPSGPRARCSPARTS